jgi:hypothetical protein
MLKFLGKKKNKKMKILHFNYLAITSLGYNSCIMFQTRILLSLWDAGLVEEALTFVEEHKVSPGPPPGPDDILTPYRRLTQQLHGLSFRPLPEDELLSPDLNTPAEDKGSMSKLFSLWLYYLFCESLVCRLYHHSFLACYMLLKL